MAKIPLVYPKMPGSGSNPGGRCVAFEKYDGTNLHWVWERDRGWVSFGTRRDSFALDSSGIEGFHAAHPGMEEAVDLFRAEYAIPLMDLFRRHAHDASERITVFTEFFGPRSFAGRHHAEDPKELVLFDVEKATGFLAPETFISHFGHLKVARVVYRGPLTGKFTEDVRRGKYAVTEGVVCKGVKRGVVWMVKIKTEAYRQKLQESFQGNWSDYWE